MALDGKPLDQIVESDLQSLIDNQVSEKRDLDYKLTVGSNDEAKKEFLYDVSSFANAAGGHLILGVAEEDGVPTELRGLSDITSVDAEKGRLESIIRDGIRPRMRIRDNQLQPVTLGNGKTVIVIHIPQSWESPHMVIFKNASKFYSRNSAGKYQLDVDEIRAAFLLSETTRERIRNSRLDRLGKIIAEETPIKLRRTPKAVLHIVPLQAFSSSVRFDVVELHQAVGSTPRMSLPDYPRFNFDGLFTYSSDIAYKQVFRDGCIEIVDADVLAGGSGNSGFIAITTCESDLIISLTTSLDVQQRLGIEPPIFVMLTLLGILGYKVPVPARYRFDHGLTPIPIDRQHLEIPEVMIEGFHINQAQAMKPMFDVIWNAGGLPFSFSYDKEGNWHGG